MVMTWGWFIYWLNPTRRHDVKWNFCSRHVSDCREFLLRSGLPSESAGHRSLQSLGFWRCAGTTWLWLTVRHGKIHPFFIGKPSISMGHCPWQTVSHNQMVSQVVFAKQIGQLEDSQLFLGYKPLTKCDAHPGWKDTLLLFKSLTGTNNQPTFFRHVRMMVLHIYLQQ